MGIEITELAFGTHQSGTKDEHIEFSYQGALIADYMVERNEQNELLSPTVSWHDEYIIDKKEAERLFRQAKLAGLIK
jgi:hypothetical protein